MLRKWLVGSVYLVSFLALSNCSVEETREEKEEADALEADIEAQNADEDGTDDAFYGSQKKAAAKPKPPKTPESGESAACTTQKQNIANQGIFIHSSGLRVRYINTRLSYANAKQACASSSGVLTLQLATKAQLSLVKDLFKLSTGAKCNTDVWIAKTTKTGTRIQMPDVSSLADGKDAKAVCVVKE
ncbi:MAG: hypothetical protein AB7T49_08165 [Oligoflexales bacterium]